jgi:hypothetical protein
MRFGTAYRSRDLVAGSLDEARNDVVGTVPRRDLSQPLDHVEVLAVRPGGHVAVPKGIRSRRLLACELRSQNIPQAPLVRLNKGAGMMSDQRGDPVIEAFGAQPTCTVERVESRHRQRRRIANIMQPCRRREYSSVRFTERCRYVFGFRTDGLHMGPATWQIIRQERGCYLARTLNERFHDYTLRVLARTTGTCTVQ